MRSSLCITLAFVPLVALAAPSYTAPRAIQLAGQAPSVPALHPDGTLNKAEAASEASRLNSRFSDLVLGEPKNRQVRRRGARSVPLTDLVSEGVDLMYYAGIKIGTPAQELPVSLDTGSSDLWVATVCRPSGCPGGYLQTGKSSTYRSTGKNFTAIYGLGGAAGVTASDVVSLGGLKVNQQYFGAVTAATSDFDRFPTAGILGLAFSANAKTGKTGFVENLIAQHKLSYNLFSVYLGRGKATGSELTIGGRNRKHYRGHIIETPVISDKYWAVQVTGAAVAGKKASSFKVATLIDSGTAYNYIPTAMAAQIFSKVKGSIKDADGTGNVYYQYPCATPPTIAFNFGGSSYNFAIEPVDENIGFVDATHKMCYSVNIGRDESVNGVPMAVLGVGFLKSWYSVFNYDGPDGVPSVGFAKSQA